MSTGMAIWVSLMTSSTISTCGEKEDSPVGLRNEEELGQQRS